MATTSTPILSKVGDITLTLGLNPPAGFLSLGEGLVLNRTQYSELWTWAQSNMKIITESEWQNLANAQDGNCGFFSSGDGSTTFRLPKIVSLLKMSELANVGNYNKSEYSNLHFHGLGRMQNNNGNWGRYSYSGATYPSGTSGWFWNGSGGTGTSGGPDSSGDIITSYNIGDRGKAPKPASINIVLCIRYTVDNQATAVTIGSEEAVAAVNTLTAKIAEVETAYNVNCHLDTIGWQVYNSGIIREWGRTEPGVSMGTIVFPIAFNADTPPYAIKVTLVDPNAEISTPGKICLGTPTSTDVSFTYSGVLPDSAYIMWEALGRN